MDWETVEITYRTVSLTVRGRYDPPCSETSDTPKTHGAFYPERIEAADSIINLWPMFEDTNAGEEIAAMCEGQLNRRGE